MWKVEYGPGKRQSRHAASLSAAVFYPLRALRLLSNSSRVLYVSAGAGQSVAALRDSGVADVTGVDLLEFPRSSAAPTPTISPSSTASSTLPSPLASTVRSFPRGLPPRWSAPCGRAAPSCSLSSGGLRPCPRAAGRSSGCARSMRPVWPRGPDEREVHKESDEVAGRAPVAPYMSPIKADQSRSKPHSEPEERGSGKRINGFGETDGAEDEDEVAVRAPVAPDLSKKGRGSPIEAAQ
uniref:Uncharacterized protein n=1 Tax=Ananas comosus var. bracteatus TaxID=296719 RepID=A0A6V7PT69_ANACO|nr:unnamed protein product [Ananas comosus var. bracteatus]